jgi:pyruvate,orthophosphate dikinase
MTCGFSRDDAEAKFLPLYVAQGILPADPFEELDTSGVGELVRLAAERGRATRPAIHLGICGEHGGDPKSIEFVSSIVDYGGQGACTTQTFYGCTRLCLSCCP